MFYYVMIGAALNFLLKKSKGDQYLKILDFSQLFVAGEEEKKIVLPPLRALMF